MKKHLRYLLTLLLVMVASVGWADTYTLGWGTASGEEGTYTNFTGTAGSVDGIVSFSTEKNSSANAPAYNANNSELRLYYNAQGNGCSITLTPAEGITITGIVMKTSLSPSVNYFVDGGTATTITASSNTYTISGISATTSLKIQNANTSNTQLRIKTIAITYSSSTPSTAVATSVTIDNTGITNTDIFAGAAAGQLTATVKDDTDTPIEGATVTWTSSKESVATIAADGTVTLVAEGTTTLTASYAGEEDVYKSSSATYELTVTNSDPDKPGSLNNPYTVAEALANTPAAGTITPEVYVRGIVSRFQNTTIMDDGANFRYYISDDGTTTSEIQVYRGKGLNNEAFSSVDDLLVGDTVVVLGKLTTYNTTKEIAADNHIISLGRNTTKVATPTFSVEEGTYTEAQSVTITTTTEGAKIYYTIDGTDPTTESNLYSEAVSITETTTLKAIAVKEGMTDSEIATATYTINIINVNPKNVGTNYFVKVTDVNELEDGDAILIVNEDNNKAMSTTQNTNNRASAVIEIVDNAIEPAEDVQKLVLVNAGDNQWMFCAGVSADKGFLTAVTSSSSQNYLRTTTDPDANANAIITITDGNASIVFQGNYTKNDLRFNANSGQMLFSCYASSSTMKSVQIYKEVEKPTSVTVTIGETEYATLYYSKVGLIVPEGVTANAYSVSGTTLNVVQTYNAGDVIPAATGVVLTGAQGDYTFNITEENGTAAEGNMLRGSDVDKTTTEGAKYYMLSLAATGGNETVGFYYGAENGAAFINKAHRAYLAVPEGTEAKATGYAFNEVTGINDITREQVTDGVWYTIDGKRLNGEPTAKGIYVVNGKKVVKK
ncbi:chitobiase/beta-hexosaminidase C-terminal domain-containing protein [Prevotella sp. Rep29]|uniref:chitobiase/beta-hexosaminidase C-terminal domain-containing protein n=1 Tax=Prevotella sp. Rep29 TaxID=2691580 RepID=UPI001CE7014F|nr:chitobiase/beta-hexosaminidase C-terminal domain-containing protein [Prevotella sp. Rep29]QYR10897.1 hypothetical protein GRF55_07230 [Prevotella sp. Rep29]